MTPDTCVSLHPYFKIHPGKIETFRELCHRFVEKTKPEPGCLYYSFTFNADVVYCREGYVDAAALVAHAQNVGALLQEAMTLADVARLEVHGPESELDKLREPFANLNPQYFVLHSGFRK
jgi:quinol monooxygenase YgiN